MALKDLGQNHEAMAKLQVLVGNQEFCGEDAVRGMSLYNVGDLHGQASQFELALHAYTEALPLLQRARRFIALADLKGMVADTLQRMGRVEESLESYREAVRDYVELGVRTRNAYMRIVLADALLGAGRIKEAEWEIRAALPIITQENMVPEGFAALGVLGEAVRQRKSDPKALVELRQYLQAKN
jgi:tetratricopeptide (TPR) repeat protein